MPRPCSVCTHPALVVIDERLQSGHPLRDIVGDYGFSKSAVERHKAGHLPARLAQEVDDLDHQIQSARQDDQWHYKHSAGTPAP